MKDNKWRFVLSAILFIAVVSYFFNADIFKDSSKEYSNNKKLKVNASFYPLYFFSSQIGGDKAQVYNITPAGAEPHDYDLTTQDIANIEKGDMLVLNGGVEAWGNKIKANLNKDKIKIITAGEGKEVMKDPHVWLNPKLAKKEVGKITEGYITIDPANTDFYKNNQTNLDNKLDQLDAEYKTGLSNCESKDIVTSHAAFSYMAERYGLNQVAISGLSPDEEPSAKQLAEVAEFAKKNKVKYIFFESLVSPKLSETIANEIGAKALVLDPIEGISDDRIKKGENYFTVMEDNLKNLQIALSCSK